MFVLHPFPGEEITEARENDYAPLGQSMGLELSLRGVKCYDLSNWFPSDIKKQL